MGLSPPVPQGVCLGCATIHSGKDPPILTLFQRLPRRTYMKLGSFVSGQVWQPCCAEPRFHCASFSGYPSGVSFKQLSTLPKRSVNFIQAACRRSGFVLGGVRRAPTGLLPVDLATVRIGARTLSQKERAREGKLVSQVNRSRDAAFVAAHAVRLGTFDGTSFQAVLRRLAGPLLSMPSRSARVVGIHHVPPVAPGAVGGGAFDSFDAGVIPAPPPMPSSRCVMATASTLIPGYSFANDLAPRLAFRTPHVVSHLGRLRAGSFVLVSNQWLAVDTRSFSDFLRPCLSHSHYLDWRSECEYLRAVPHHFRCSCSGLFFHSSHCPRSVRNLSAYEGRFVIHDAELFAKFLRAYSYGTCDNLIFNGEHTAMAFSKDGVEVRSQRLELNYDNSGSCTNRPDPPSFRPFPPGHLREPQSVGSRLGVGPFVSGRVSEFLGKLRPSGGVTLAERIALSPELSRIRALMLGSYNFSSETIEASTGHDSFTTPVATSSHEVTV